MTGEKAACLHDATYALDHEDNLDGQSDKQAAEHSREISGEQQSIDGSILCRFATDSMMVMISSR